jgi:hypothetical protein
MSSPTKILQGILRQLDELQPLGWSYRPSGKGFFVTSPDGQCTIGASRDGHAMRNAESQLNSIGFARDVLRIRGDQEDARQKAIAVDARKAAARVPVVTFTAPDPADQHTNGHAPRAAATVGEEVVAQSEIAFVEETITPEFAEELLRRPRPRLRDGRELIQRTLKESHVLRLAGIIERGEWQLTPQGLIIAKDGGVLDGQHRLNAIALAKTPVQMMVAYGADPEIFQVLDTGIVRTYADVAKTKGRQNTFHLSSAAKLMWAYNVYMDDIRAGENPTTWPNWSKLTPSHVQLDKLVDDTPELESQVRPGTNMVSKLRGIVAAAIVFRALILREIDAAWPEDNPRFAGDRAAALDLLELFSTALTTGEMIGAGHPAYTVREWLRGGAKGGGVNHKARREIQLIVLLKSWRKFCKTIKMEAARVQSFEAVPAAFVPKDPGEALRAVRIRNASPGGWARASARDEDDVAG